MLYMNYKPAFALVLLGVTAAEEAGMVVRFVGTVTAFGVQVLQFHQ